MTCAEAVSKISAALGIMSTIVWRYPAHKTRAVFDRYDIIYDIIDEEDQRRTLERQQEYRNKKLAEPRKVVPIRQAG